MEQSIADIQSYPPLNNECRKSSNTISWLGFGFSLFVLILMWFTFIIAAIIIRNDSDRFSSGALGIVMIFLLIGSLVGLLGLIFSIVGLIKATNSGGKKWIGVCGLIFSGLSVVSIFVPIFLSAFTAKEPTMIKAPASMITDNPQENKVVFVVDGYQLKCYDNRETNEVEPYQTRLEYSYQIKKELGVWFKMHNVSKDEIIILKVSTDTDYSQVAELMDALKYLGRNNVQLTTSL